MRLCASNLGTGIREDLCFRQPEPEAEGYWGGYMMLIALYVSLGRRAPPTVAHRFVN